MHADGGLCIAESDLNDPRLVEQYGLDACWADDFHHALHVALTGESQGYYGDYQDPMPKLVAALKRGWFYQGQYKPGFGRPHGAPAAHLPGRRFVVCAQNHDQIGNRARGERLTELTDEGGLRAPRPCWRCSLRCRSTSRARSGRRRRHFYTSYHTRTRRCWKRCAKAGARNSRRSPGRAEVPDPAAEETFLRCRIDRTRKDPAAIAWHRALLQLRRTLRDDSRASLRTEAQGTTLLLEREHLLLVAALGAKPSQARLPPGEWRVLLDSGAGKRQGDLLSLRGRGAVVLTRG